MKMLNRRILLRMAGATLLVLALAVVAVGILYLRARKRNAEILPPAAAAISATEAPLGTPMTVSARFRSTWRNRPVKVELDVPSKGVQVVGSPTIRLDRIGPGTWEWTVSRMVRPYRTGVVTGLRLLVEFSDAADPDGNAPSFSVEAPSCTVVALPVENPDELALASPIRFDKTDRRRLALLVATSLLTLVLLAVVAYLWWRRHARAGVPVILPPWGVALAEIRDIGEQFRKKEISGEQCVSRLTDVVRFYLERQFRLRSQRQTTPEFLRDLDRADGPMQSEHRQFLRDFMSAAELIKFAHCPADPDLLENAIGKASRLVEETHPKEGNNPTPEVAP